MRESTKALLLVIGLAICLTAYAASTIQSAGYRDKDLVEFLAQLKDSHTRARIDIPLTSVRDSSGDVLTSADTAAGPDLATNDNGTVLEWDETGADEHGAIEYTFKVPGDYDTGADTLTLHYHSLNDGGADDPSLAHTVYVLSEGTASRGADLDPTDPTTGKDHTADTPVEITVDLSGNSLSAGDLVEVNVDPAASTTDSPEIWSIWVTYTPIVGGGDGTTEITVEGED